FPTLSGEKWKPVKDTGGRYYISNKGRLLTTGWRGSTQIRIMKPAIDGSGYYRDSILIKGKLTTVKMHRLVAQHFIPNQLNKSQVNHIEFDRINNKVENLEWVTPKENAQHSLKAGRLVGFKKGVKHKNHPIGEQVGNAILTADIVREIRQKHRPRIYTRKMIAEEYGITESAVKDVLSRRSWKHVK